MDRESQYRLTIGQFVWPEDLLMEDAIEILERLKSCVHGVRLEVIYG